jgi:hypothetical protein
MDRPLHSQWWTWNERSYTTGDNLNYEGWPASVLFIGCSWKAQTETQSDLVLWWRGVALKAKQSKASSSQRKLPGEAHGPVGPCHHGGMAATVSVTVGRTRTVAMCNWHWHWHSAGNKSRCSKLKCVLSAKLYSRRSKFGVGHMTT